MLPPSMQNSTGNILNKIIQSGLQIIDVRSPSEYKKGHIPGSINIPLLNDAERVLVGTCYKTVGKEAATDLGFKLVGKKFHLMISKVRKINPTNAPFYVYCWRGGMRSSIFQWVMKTSGFEAEKISGGYKEYRNEVLLSFENPFKMVSITGKTGCGKTRMLVHIQKLGVGVVDLEKIANHRGSAFGGIGKNAQPSQEMFENNLSLALLQNKDLPYFFVENESRRIGKLKLPDPFYFQLIEAKVICIETPIQFRRKNILNEYGKFDNKLLEDATRNLIKRLGIERTNQAIDALNNNNKALWLDILLEYYDKSYLFGFEKNNQIINKNLYFDKITKKGAIQIIEIANELINA